ncbi:MAG TPA: DUF192 domain-containing protein [Nitrospirales bacterium]|nr:DUF192 domain-containing protein [Nitrospirales bacterium]
MSPILPAALKSPANRSRVLVLIVVSIALVGGSVFLMNPGGSDTILVAFPSGAVLETEVADTPEKLLFGLAFRESLPPGSGMLYIFETSDRHRVRTTAFTFPVDIIWVDESHHVVDVHPNAAPCPREPCVAYGPPVENARYVIETAAGFAQQEHVAPGMELKFTLRM